MRHPTSTLSLTSTNRLTPASRSWRPSVSRRHGSRAPPRGRRRCCALSALAGGRLFVGLDVGTQSTKAVVYEEESREVVGRGSVAYSLHSSRPGQAEQHPATWVEVGAPAALPASNPPHNMRRSIARRSRKAPFC
jgi:hypothetical protein